MTKGIEIKGTEKLTKGRQGGMQLTHGKEGIEKMEVKDKLGK